MSELSRIKTIFFHMCFAPGVLAWALIFVVLIAGDELKGLQIPVLVIYGIPLMILSVFMPAIGRKMAPSHKHLLWLKVVSWSFPLSVVTFFLVILAMDSFCC